MASTVFQRPIGPWADAKELEYIAALHQTCPILRKDGSISAVDVVNYLSSRQGIIVTKDEVISTILKGLGGGDGDDEIIDLTEVVAILLIPYFLKVVSMSNGGTLESIYNKKDLHREQHQQHHGDGSQHDDMKDLLPHSTTIISDVIRMILNDTFNSTEPRALNSNTLRAIFTTYGENELADDDDLILEMILSASGGGDADENPMLDAESFGRGLTFDTHKFFRLENELKITSNYYDVFKTHYSTSEDGLVESSTTSGTGGGGGRVTSHSTEESIRTSSHDEGGGTDQLRVRFLDPTVSSSRDLEEQLILPRDDDDDHEEQDDDDEEEEENDIIPVKKIYTAPAIDYTVDTYRSKFFTVLLWAFVLMSNFTYLPSSTQRHDWLGCEDDDGTGSFGCGTVNQIIQWLLSAIILGFGGAIFMSIASFGNSIYATSKLAVLCATLLILTSALIPFISTYGELEGNNALDNDEDFARYTTVLMGLTLVVMNVIHLAGLCCLAKNKHLKTFFVYGNVISEARLKQAAARKVNRLVQNAMKIHDPVTTTDVGMSGNLDDVAVVTDESDKSYSRALLNFGKRGILHHEKIGGYVWTWKSVINKDLTCKEGLWLHSRLLIGNISQLLMAAFILVLGVIIATQVTYEDNKDIEIALRTAGWVGSLAGFTASLSIVLVYIPSAVSTALKFRCGVIPSLQDDYFRRYRLGPESVSRILGCMFWGVFYSGFWIFAFFAVVTFFARYKETRKYFGGIVSQFIGFSITAGLKIILLLFLNRAFYAGLYRTKPASANFTVLVLECWNIGLSVGYMLIRAVKLTLVTFFYIGRIDTPIIAPGVGMIFGIELDDYPTVFRRDIISHDAHRHPYLETLGVMYMMKLRYGENFARKAGSVWRLLFVFALMPWLRKSRVIVREAIVDEEDEEEEEGGGGSDDKQEGEGVTTVFSSDDTTQKVEVGYYQSEKSVNRLLAENVRLRDKIKSMRGMTKE